MKTLIIFYSFDGNTKFIAETIKNELNADILELKTKKDLLNKDSLTKYFWGGKMVFMKEKVELEDFEVNFSIYDLIIIGTPVWAFSYTPPFTTFFSKNLLQNKKIVLYCSHEGGPGKTLQKMEEQLIGNEIISKKDFFSPLKKETEITKQKIINWSKELKKS